MKEQSFITIPSSLVISQARETLEWIKKQRELLWQDAITEQAKKRKFWLGPRYTRTEAEKYLMSDGYLASTHTLIFVCDYHAMEKLCEKIISVASLTDTINLTVGDASTIGF